jgi:hypothetical protein
MQERKIANTIGGNINFACNGCDLNLDNDCYCDKKILAKFRVCQPYSVVAAVFGLHKEGGYWFQAEKYKYLEEYPEIKMIFSATRCWY